MALHRQERFGDARPWLESVVDGRDTEQRYRSALLAAGDGEFQRDRWPAAEQHLRDYLSFGLDQPGADDALLKLGLAQQRQGDRDGALETFGSLIDQRDDSPHRLHGLFETGQVLVELDRHDEARTVFEQVLEQGPESPFAGHAMNHLGALALRDGDFSEAALFFGSAASKLGSGDAAAEALFQQGRALMAARSYDRARSVLSTLLGSYPSHERTAQASALHAVALSRQDVQDEAGHQSALAAIERVEARHLGSLEPALRASLWYEKAWCLRELGRYDDAAHTYRRVLDQEQSGDQRVGDVCDHATLELAELEADAGRYQEAAELLRRLERRTGGTAGEPVLHRQVEYRLGLCEFHLGRHVQAATMLESWLGDEPDAELVPSARLLCAESLINQGRYGRAIEHLDRLVTDHPGDESQGPGLLRLGTRHGELQNWPSSEEAFATYLQRFEGSELWFQAQFGIGWARENQGRYDDAIAAYHLVTARHQGPTAARAQFQVGECLFAQKKYDETSPAVSPAGDFVYFASDRPGGAGGFDLYRSRRVHGAHMPALSLGEPVNTAADELDPAVSLGGFGLHFAAEGDGSFDLRYTVSREVFTRTETYRSELAWGTMWTDLWPYLLWLLVGIALLGILAGLLHRLEYRKLTLLARCMMASLVIHLLVMVAFGFWGVSSVLSEWTRPGRGTRVVLTAPSVGAGLAHQVRAMPAMPEQPDVRAQRRGERGPDLLAIARHAGEPAGPGMALPVIEAGEVDALTRISPPGASRVFEPSRVVHAAAPDAPGPASSTRVAIDVAPTVSRPAALAFDLPRLEESSVVSEPERAHGPVTVPVSARHRRWAPPAEADPRRADVGVTRYTVEAAVRFIYEARGLSVGGWRYRPGQAGDTSVMGWQIMALTSARRAGIDVPDDAFDIAAKWLDLVHRPSQPGTYTYQPRREVTPAMTAEGMFVRQLLGAGRDEPRMRGSAKYILDHPPGWRPDANTYYWYYATLALFQHQGSEWRQWNESIKLLLVGRQLTSGRMAGSCDPDGRWAGVAGRVYQTAIATLTLEVYYRYLPSFVRQP